MTQVFVAKKVSESDKSLGIKEALKICMGMDGARRHTERDEAKKHCSHTI